MRGPWFILCLWAAFAIASPGFAENEFSTIRIPHVGRGPKIDDFVQGRPREAEKIVTNFRQRDPLDGAPSSSKTTAYLSYDDENLYVVFECEADRTTLRARMNKRDNLSGDEAVNVSLDTFHDGRRAYMFFANPLGVQMDGITSEGQEEDDFTFDTVWKAEGRLTSKGYIVWMAIPFRSLRFVATPGSTWGIALTRYVPNNKEFAVFPRITNKIEGYVNQFATLEGLDFNRNSRGHNIQINPYLFGANQKFLDDNLITAGRGPLRNHNELRGGVDAKVVLKNALTLDVTVNPDFSQIESDQPQVTVNRRFEVFFPERRPFFIENSGYFETPETLFFSRRIVDPRFGARLTGKAGRWSIGALAADDRAGSEAGEFLDREGNRASIGVFRVQRDFGNNSTIGGLFTTRTIGLETNRVASVDTRWRIHKNWVFTGQAIRSDDKNPRGNNAGQSYLAEIRESGRHLTYYTTFRERTPEFRAPLGFITRADVREVTNYAAYRWRPETGPVLNWGPSFYSYANWDHTGRLQDWIAEIPFRVEFKGPTTLKYVRNEAYEFYRGIGFRKNFDSYFFSSDKFKRFGITANWAQGKDVNFYPGSGLKPFSARSSESQLGITLRPAPGVRIDESYLYTRLAGFGGNQGVVFNNHIARSKIHYQINRRTSLRWIAEYRGTLPNEELVNLERSKRFVNDVLVTYLIQPGTALHFGYSDRRENLLEDGIRRFGNPRLLTGRQFFIKLSYLFRI